MNEKPEKIKLISQKYPALNFQPGARRIGVGITTNYYPIEKKS